MKRSVSCALEASLSAQDSTNVRVGRAAELRIEDSGQAVKASLARINPSAQAGSRSLLVYLSIANAGSHALPLRRGLFAPGTLVTPRGGEGTRVLRFCPASRAAWSIAVLPNLAEQIANAAPGRTGRGEALLLAARVRMRPVGPSKITTYTRCHPSPFSPRNPTSPP